MTTRTLCKNCLLTLSLLISTVGCEQRTPDQRAAATKNVLKEVLGESAETQKKTAANVASAIGDAGSVAPTDLAPSVVKQPDSSEPVAVAPESNAEATDASKQKSEQKITPKSSVDDPSKNWLGTDSFPRETWEVQYFGNNAVGYFHHRVEKKDLGSVRHTAEGKLRVSIKGEPMEQHLTLTSLEGGNGELLSLEGSLTIGENSQKFNAKVNGDTLTLNGVENDKPFSVTIPWERRFRGPFAVEQSMLRKPMQPREVRKLKYFDPLLRKLIDGRLEASDYITTPTMYGGVKELLEVRNIGMVGDEGSQALLWVDKDGEGFKSYVPENDVLSFRTLPIDAEVVASMTELRREELVDVTIGGSVDKLFNNRRKAMTFEVGHKVENPFRILFEDNAQRIRSADALLAHVTVYFGGRSSDSYQEPAEASNEESGFLSSSAFIPADNERIIKRANVMVEADKSITRESATNFQKANACRREIQKRIAVREFDKRIGLFTNILKNKQANCVEHALFLAAHCRALSIPTRVVLGLKYNQVLESPKMVFHAWVEIQDGKRWIPMDSTDKPSAQANPSASDANDEGKATIDRIKLKATSFNSPNPYIEILRICKLLPGFQIKALAQDIP